MREENTDSVGRDREGTGEEGMGALFDLNTLYTCMNIKHF